MNHKIPVPVNKSHPGATITRKQAQVDMLAQEVKRAPPQGAWLVDITLL